MNAESYQRAVTVFRTACELPAAQRESFIQRECGDDGEAADLVRRMIAAEPDEASDATEPLVGYGARLLAGRLGARAPEVGMPTQIGQYRILRLLGEGGMGVVFEAEQDRPRRRVALKVMRAGVLDESGRSRFDREIDALGKLHHPGIAQIFEAGRAPLGDGGLERPYFAMELVQGESLRVAADAQQLTLQQRLRVLADVCDAVQHAHQNGIIHRDLKPANVLLTADSRVKVLDFGIARIAGNPRDTLQTQAGQIVGTLAYMSPEQLGGDAAIDTRADVYALGVMMYELLSGRLPLALRDVPLVELARRLAEAEPPPLDRLDPRFRGDLAVIAGRAMEKHKSRRYASASELAGDIRRHLRSEPILARPATATYTLRKFVRRHRVGVTGAAVAAIAGVGGLTYGLLEARAQRDEARLSQQAAVKSGAAEKTAREAAQRESRITAAINRFWIQEVLESVSPDNTPNRDIRMRDVLSAAAAKIEGKFPDEPLVEAGVRAALGKTYLRMGEYAAAQMHLSRAVKLRSEHLAPTDPDLFETLGIVANLLYQKGDYAEAARHLQELTALARRVYGDDHELTVSTMGSLGFVLLQQRQFAAAEPLLADAVERSRRRSPQTIDSVTTLVNLAMCYMRTQRFDQAEAPLREAVEVGRRVGGEDHPETLNALGVLAACYNEKEEFAEAIPLLKTVLAAQSRVLGDENPQTLMTRANLGYSLLRSPRLEEAEEVLDSVLNSRTRVLGEAHPHTLASLYNLAFLRHAQGRLNDAEGMLLRGMELRSTAKVDIHPPLETWQQMLAKVRATREQAPTSQTRPATTPTERGP
ncbi:MAG: tetratricopeptide repeat protein [Phycisphaerae bacterium]